MNQYRFKGLNTTYKKCAYTLVEIMVVIALMGVLFSIAAARFGDSLRKTREGQTRANLGQLRSALKIYFSDNLAWFPVGDKGDGASTLETTLVPRYLKKIPESYVYPYHVRTSKVDNIVIENFNSSTQPDEGGWVYISTYSSSGWGRIAVECVHEDSTGQIWTEK